jgi:hypothetical protein
MAKVGAGGSFWPQGGRIEMRKGRPVDGLFLLTGADRFLKHSWFFLAAYRPPGALAAQTTSGGLRAAQAVFRRRRHQPSSPAPATTKPGKPTPTMGPGTATGSAVIMRAKSPGVE